MKICFVSTKAEKLFWPEAKTSFGGSEMQQFLLAEELSRSYETAFILASIKKIDHQTIKVVSAFSLNKSWLAKIKAVINLYGALKRVAPDVVIQRAHGPETLICALYARLNGKKFIYSIASQADVDGTWTKGALGKLFKLGIEGADLLVSQNKAMTSQAKQQGLPKYGLIREIPKGLIIKPLSTKKELILWIGRCIKMKRPAAFLKLAKDNPDLKFAMVCPPGADPAFNKKISDQASVIKNLKFQTYLPPHQIADLHAQARVFVLTSLWEGDLPMVVLESLAQKNPVLTLSYDPDDIITKHKIGLSANNSLAKLNKQLKTILDNHQDFSHHAFDFVRSRYDINKVGKEWRRAIKDLYDQG
ncbi:glycosyltransferase family 4 protein [Candidatus Berkelbacteria bacterium]|nr:glycosyltransferase family 4 protein [Candidatus Berkelbacteria bacterium]